MKQLTYLLFFSLITNLACAQKGSNNMCTDIKFDEEVNSYLDYTIPIISVEDLKKLENEIVLFDARELIEYETSHIQGAKYVGYDNFTTKHIKDIDKSTKVIIYCSIGYRSEKIGEKLRDLGYTNIYNLYGSIFEWANQGNKIVASDGKPTNKLHTYNKKWSKWVNNPSIEKIF